MWVEISSIKNNIYSGKLVNYPKHINILFGDLVSFTNKNIINIEFSNDDTANNIFHKNCYVTEDVFKKHKVGYIYKEEPDEDMDSGWRMFTGDESDDYLENSKNFKYLPISEILLICDSFIKLLGSEPESYFMKNNETNLWEKI